MEAIYAERGTTVVARECHGNEKRGEVRDCVIQGVNEGEGRPRCEVCDRDSERRK